jgi:hypothetical protein
MLQKMLPSKDCAEFFGSILDLPISLEILLSDDLSVLRLIDIARRNVVYRETLTEIISSKMHLLSLQIFEVFISLGRDDISLFLKYFIWAGKKACDMKWICDTRQLVRQKIFQVIGEMLDEEKALGSVVQSRRYRDMCGFVKELVRIETIDEGFGGKGGKGHVTFLMKGILDLVGCRSVELSGLAKAVLENVLN